MTTVGAGKFTYTYIQDWAKMPAGQSLGTVSAIATDSQDRVYAFQRAEPPVVIFDRNGEFLSSWGNGNFVDPTDFSSKMTSFTSQTGKDPRP